MVQLHKASLVEPECHSQKMLDLLELTVSKRLIRYIVDVVVDVTTHAMKRSLECSRDTPAPSYISYFLAFATDVIERSKVKVPAMLVSLVYLQRAKECLFIQCPVWVYERVFLGALILANKYVNDCSIKNFQWAQCTRVFGRRDMRRIEHEFLNVLDWDLSVTEADILNHYDHISNFDSRSSRVPVPALSPASKNVDVQWETLDGSPLSSASPTPSPQTPSTVVSPSDQPASVHSLSNELSQTDATVKELFKPEPEQGKRSDRHPILGLFRSSFKKHADEYV